MASMQLHGAAGEERGSEAEIKTNENGPVPAVSWILVMFLFPLQEAQSGDTVGPRNAFKNRHASASPSPTTTGDSLANKGQMNKR